MFFAWSNSSTVRPEFYRLRQDFTCKKTFLIFLISYSWLLSIEPFFIIIFLCNIFSQCWKKARKTKKQCWKTGKENKKPISTETVCSCRDCTDLPIIGKAAVYNFRLGMLEILTDLVEEEMVRTHTQSPDKKREHASNSSVCHARGQGVHIQDFFQSAWFQYQTNAIENNIKKMWAECEAGVFSPLAGSYIHVITVMTLLYLSSLISSITFPLFLATFSLLVFIWFLSLCIIFTVLYPMHCLDLNQPKWANGLVCDIEENKSAANNTNDNNDNNYWRQAMKQTYRLRFIIAQIVYVM